jgi:hypothetical protein
VEDFDLVRNPLSALTTFFLEAQELKEIKVDSSFTYKFRDLLLDTSWLQLREEYLVISYIAVIIFNNVFI